MRRWRPVPWRGLADALAGFFAEEDQSAAGAAAEAALVVRAAASTTFAGEGGHGAGLVVDVAIAAQIARIVEDDLFLVRSWLWTGFGSRSA